MFFKIIGGLFSYMAIGIIVFGLLCAVGNKTIGDEEDDLSPFAAVMWPLALILLVFCYTGEGIKFLTWKMIDFWKIVLPTEDENQTVD